MAGDGGPVIVVTGEADIISAGQLRDVISAELASGAVFLTIDAAGLSFADSAAIGVLAGTGRTLRELGGRLVLLRPQQAVLRKLTLLGVTQVITVHAAADIAGRPEGDAGAGPPP